MNTAQIDYTQLDYTGDPRVVPATDNELYFPVRTLWAVPRDDSWAVVDDSDEECNRYDSVQEAIHSVLGLPTTWIDEGNDLWRLHLDCEPDSDAPHDHRDLVVYLADGTWTAAMESPDPNEPLPVLGETRDKAIRAFFDSVLPRNP